MVSIRARAPLSGKIEADKGIRLSNGVAVDLSSFNICLNKKPSQPVLDTIVARVQSEIYHVQLPADLPDDDPGKTATGQGASGRVSYRSPRRWFRARLGRLWFRAHPAPSTKSR